jgi:hypothetical protein
MAAIAKTLFFFQVGALTVELDHALDCHASLAMTGRGAMTGRINWGQIPIVLDFQGA